MAKTPSKKTDSSANLGFALGATEYLIKPINRPFLLQTLRKHVPLRSDEDMTILLVDDNGGDVEMLEDLVLAAVSEAQNRAQQLYEDEMRKLSGGFNFPFSLPEL